VTAEDGDGGPAPGVLLGRGALPSPSTRGDGASGYRGHGDLPAASPSPRPPSAPCSEREEQREGGEGRARLRDPGEAHGPRPPTRADLCSSLQAVVPAASEPSTPWPCWQILRCGRRLVGHLNPRVREADGVRSAARAGRPPAIN